MKKAGLVYELIEKERILKTGKLNLSFFGLSEVPNEIKELHWLRVLDLSSNQIKDIGFLENLPKLNELVLRSNLISDISILAKMTQLHTLELTSNLIDDISFLVKITGLKKLNIGYNYIIDISFIKELKNLNTLSLYYNQISEVGCLENLTNLVNLNIGSNQISDISFLLKLSKLESLNLSSNQISDISFLQSLTKIRSIDLCNNLIRDISPLMDLILANRFTLRWHEYGSGILIKNNPLLVPPPEIVKRGKAAVLNYLSKLIKERVKLYESKMLFVGQGEVGKTWLLNRLITGKAPFDGETTEGINIKQWHFNSNDIKDFRVNLWDFGGQEIYHATHQFFLSKRSLYLFVWDARKELDIITSFDYWLNIISLLSNNAPIIVVMNKCDERTKAIEEETLKNKFKNIVGFHKVSAKDGTGIEYLKFDIQRHILSLPQVGNTLPKVWNDIRKELEQLDKYCISNTEYKGICLKYGLNAKDAEFIGDYYHDVGVFLHFRDNPILDNLIFLNPEWATNAVYKIIDTKEVTNAFGKFQFSQLKTIWNEYDEDKFVYLIELMKRFELCFQLGTSENYIVPELLRPEFTDLQWDYSNNLRFEYNYTFMPAGIITRFITRQHRLIKDELYWRNGLVISKNSTEALIISEPLNRKIRIWIKGDEAKELLFLIRLEIEDIHETLNFPDVKQMYPCNCEECTVSQNPFFFASDMLVKLTLKEIDTVQCQNSGLPIKIEELRGAIASKTDIAVDTIIEIGSKQEGKLNEIIQILEDNKSQKPGKESPLDAFFKIVKLDFGVINVGEVLKRLLKYKERKFI